MKANGRKSADEVLALAIAAGKTIAAACVDAGIGETTAYRRLREPGFTDRVKQLRADMVSRAAGCLADSMAKAAGVLRELLDSPTEAIRLRAAAELIDRGLKVAELADLQARIEALERSANGGPTR